MRVSNNGASRRLVILIVTASFFIAFIFVSAFRNLDQGTRDPAYIAQQAFFKAQLQRQQSTAEAGGLGISEELLKGHAIAPKLGNETAKVELGRASWKLFHTVFARFPDEPTKEESLALLSYVHLFQRLYPCGECATHFGEILDRFPPQVSSRSTAAAWGCHVHNEVNKSLKKSMFDCSKIGDFYDCGCAEDEEEHGKKSAASQGTAHKVREPASDERTPAELVHEGWMPGG